MFSISFVWLSKFLKIFLFDLIFDFLDVTYTLIYSLFIVIVLNVKPLSSFISIQMENLTLE